MREDSKFLTKVDGRMNKFTVRLIMAITKGEGT